jgi:hypothetical protein
LGRIRWETYSCNPLISPRLGQFGPNWVNKFFCVLSFFLSMFSTFVCDYNYQTLRFGCLIITCSTHQVYYWCDFSSNSQQLAPTVGHGSKEIKYHGSKWDIEKFTGDNDFGLWKVKMESVLIHQKCEKASKGEGALPVTMS